MKKLWWIVIVALCVSLVLAQEAGPRPVDRYDLNDEVALPPGALQIEGWGCMAAAAGLNQPDGQSTCLIWEVENAETTAQGVLAAFEAAGYVVGEPQRLAADWTAYRLTTPAWAHSLLLATNTGSQGYLSVTIVLLVEVE